MIWRPLVRLFFFAGCLGLGNVLQAQEVLDRLEDALQVISANEQARVHLSGTFDLEYYHFDQPEPGLILSGAHDLLNPRLSLFLDSQLGPDVYVFAQARLDRGFDPADLPLEARLDEYAIRYSPSVNGRFSLQVGKFATVFGAWVGRHLSWDNPFVTAPLAYENTTALHYDEVPSSRAEFHDDARTEKYDRLPLIWGPSYASGISMSGQLGTLEYAAEVKNTGLSSHPASWDVTATGFSHPAYAARFGWVPDARWRLGLSVASSPWLDSAASSDIPPGKHLEDYRQQTLGQDISFAWHHWQFWAECEEASFHIPSIGNVGGVAYFLESRYAFAPQWYAALRWNQQTFSNLDTGDGQDESWSRNLWKIDSSIGYRISAHLQAKLQYSLQNDGTGVNHLIVSQLTLRF